MDAVKTRLQRLRQKMEQEEIAALVIPTADFHASEYVGDYFKVREYYSGFTGSNGTLVILPDEAGLWTDGRYFIQAERELTGSGITLYRMGEEKIPTVFEFLEKRMQKGERIAADGRVVSLSFSDKIEKICKKCGCFFLTETDPAGDLWEERPKRPNGPVHSLPLSLTGEDVTSKLSRVRRELARRECDSLLLNRLDDIMWLFNIRGKDVPYNPVALSYAYLTMEKAVLFVQDSSFSMDGVLTKPYDGFGGWLDSETDRGKRTAVDETSISISLYRKLAENGEAVRMANPVEALKAVKNETEINRLREVYRKDSAAVVKFLYWLKKNAGKIDITEISAAEYLHQKRAETEGFQEESFATISAYRENAAMMHYEPSNKHPVRVRAEGMLLVDSGGQYLGGTTDVTRTVVLGPVSDAEILHFTKTAVGMLRLAAARFPEGCTGRNLDILARGPLWDLGIDYKCGTGHGVGYMLNVHEGPQAVRWRPTEPSSDGVLLPGMLISDEPGVYREGKYGIRTENILLVKKDEKTEDAQFLSFEMLTFVPIDLAGIDRSLLEERDRRLLNEYHRQVYEETAPYLTAAEAEWLREQTAPV